MGYTSSGSSSSSAVIGHRARSPEGTHIQDTATDLAEIDEWIRENVEGVTHTATFAGQGSMRFQLTYKPEDVNSAYGQIVISVDDYTKIDSMRAVIQEHMSANHPDAESWTIKFVVGPGGGAKIEAQFSGPDRQVLTEIDVRFDDNIIRRMYRSRAVRAQCDQGVGTAEALRSQMAAEIEAIELPQG